uniref:Uncharacterized protein n=1 Tax=Arundo donax TaxID=35708 RepID=A0A0A9BWW0_ARUDO
MDEDIVTPGIECLTNVKNGVKQNFMIFILQKLVVKI